MGIIRLLLALAVVRAHTGSPLPINITFIDGVSAVKIFFIISGFYMALVLNEKYQPTQNRAFYYNRILRLWPIYFVIMSLYMLFVVKGNYNPVFAAQPFWVSCYAIFTNISILGSHLLYFLNFNPTEHLLSWCPNGSACSPNLQNLIINVPIFSLSIELIFYFFAPYILRLSRIKQVAIFTLAVVYHLLLIKTGNNNVGYNYQCFPGALMFFMAGSLSYQGYRLIRNSKIAFYLGLAAFLLMIRLVTDQTLWCHLPNLYTFHREWSTVYTNFNTLFLFSAVLIPFVFRISNKNKLDQYIGNLSYPVYVAHFPMIQVLTPYVSHAMLATVTLLITVGFSIIILLLVEKPLDALKRKRAKIIFSQPQIATEASNA